ncbi:hypothetical protein HC256_005943 [Beauveria bassiana]|nr:hypothetical protein HC256_005943 [Beauveria bassiana]
MHNRRPLRHLDGNLLATLHVLEELGVARLFVVNAALGLGLALPAASALVLAVLDGNGRVPVADGLVALVEEGVVGDVVCLDVIVDLGKGPGGERADLDDAALLVELDDGDGAAGGALGAAAAVENGGDIEGVVRPLQGLDLDNVVVHVAGGVVELFAIRGLELRRRVGAVGLEDVDGYVGVAGLDALDQVVRLVKVVQGVEEDEVDGAGARALGLDLGQHVHGDEAGQAKGG